MCNLKKQHSLLSVCLAFLSHYHLVANGEKQQSNSSPCLFDEEHVDAGLQHPPSHLLSTSEQNCSEIPSSGLYTLNNINENRSRILTKSKSEHAMDAKSRQFIHLFKLALHRPVNYTPSKSSPDSSSSSIVASKPVLASPLKQPWNCTNVSSSSVAPSYPHPRYTGCYPSTQQYCHSNVGPGTLDNVGQFGWQRIAKKFNSTDGLLECCQRMESSITRPKYLFVFAWRVKSMPPLWNCLLFSFSDAPIIISITLQFAYNFACQFSLVFLRHPLATTEQILITVKET